MRAHVGPMGLGTGHWGNCRAPSSSNTRNGFRTFPASIVAWGSRSTTSPNWMTRMMGMAMYRSDSNAWVRYGVRGTGIPPAVRGEGGSPLPSPYGYIHPLHEPFRTVPSYIGYLIRVTLRAASLRTTVTPPERVPWGRNAVHSASYVPTQRDRWSGGQRPVRSPISTRSHPRTVGLSHTSANKTTSVTTSTLWTTSEVVWGPPILCHCAKLCVSSPCVFLGLFFFQGGSP